LLAINAATGALVWKTQLESTDPAAAITVSPVVVNGVVYTGVTSLVEGATFSGYSVSQAVSGSVLAVNAATGSIQWKTRTVPAGYSGAGVWGSNPAVDTSRNTIFVGTGNNYRHPDPTAPSSGQGSYGDCISAGGTAASCNSPDDHVDSILALDLRTGNVKWATKLVTWGLPFDGSDDWNVDCAVPLPPNVSQCPTNPGPDYDFGSAPNEITYQSPTGPKTIIGAGQKSGIYYALDPDTGVQLWHTQVGPGSSLGGMEWGSASDGKRIYVQNTNLYGLPSPAGGSAGSWAALDPATGAILWQQADPNGFVDVGPMAVANGVVYASSMAGSPGAPTMLALDAATGKTLWGFAAGSSVNAGATIVQDTVYWGSGYTHLPIPGFTGNNKFYAFTVNGK
jgi:polyvinyl alcohol dehydrogenase (cytochrome)